MPSSGFPKPSQTLLLVLLRGFEYMLAVVCLLSGWLAQSLHVHPLWPLKHGPQTKFIKVPHPYERELDPSERRRDERREVREDIKTFFPLDLISPFRLLCLTTSRYAS